jgi:NADPH-dependent glutamate synthase beta subunit-like oxidoreductase/ferredoxin
MKMKTRAKVEAKRKQVEEVVNKTTGKTYLPPCQVACPIGEDIQRTNVMISLLPTDVKEAYNRIVEIGDEIYEKNPLFTICGYVCGLCERQCNYKDKTGAIRRRLLKRFLTDYYTGYLDTKPGLPYPRKGKVAVIGGGPGGVMAAHMLSKKGYRVTIFERGIQLGGALRSIPQYRLPANVVDATLNNLVRIAHIDVRYGVKMGNGGKSLDDLKKEGYRAVFIATGTPAPRPLTFEGKVVVGADLEGVASGLNLLWEVNQSQALHQLYRRLFSGRRVIVIGGGNVAFDVARTVRRLRGDVTVVCLENKDKTSRDGIPADVEEIEGAEEEGIKIIYSRGVQEIIGDNGKFKKIKSPKCIQVFDASGFNPKFDKSDVIELEGDALLVTIGQGAERAFFQQESLFNEKGRLDVDPFTLMSTRKEGVFIGGDVRRIGFAAEAMRDGTVAAESIDRYIRGVDMKVGREKESETAAIPKLEEYKAQPELEWTPVQDRLNFDLFEKGLTLEEAIKEARRCLCCGPCKGCKACVMLGFQPEISEVYVDQELCSGCGVCIGLCPYDAITRVPTGVSNNKGTVVIDELKCKRCGACSAACPSCAIFIENSTSPKIMKEIEEALV